MPTKTQIKSQAKSEVGELLTDYVISPLKKCIQSTSAQSEENVGTIVAKKAKEEGERLSGEISSLRSMLRDGVLNKMPEDTTIPDVVSDTVSGVVKDICRDIEALETSLAKLEPLLCDTKQSLRNVSQQNTKALMEAISSASRNINREIKVSARSTGQSLADLKDQLKAFKAQVGTLAQQMNDSAQSSAATEQRLAELTQRMDTSQAMARELAELARQIESGISGFSQASLRELAEFSNAEEGSHTETHRRIDSLADRLEQSHTCVMERQDEMKAELNRYRLETKDWAEKRYKTLLTASLVIGAANLIGIITLALICFL